MLVVLSLSIAQANQDINSTILIDTRVNAPVAPVYDYQWGGGPTIYPQQPNAMVPGKCYTGDLNEAWLLPLNITSITGHAQAFLGAGSTALHFSTNSDCKGQSNTITMTNGNVVNFTLSEVPWLPGFNGGYFTGWVDGGTHSDLLLVIDSYTTDGPPIWRTGQTGPGYTPWSPVVSANTPTPLPPTATTKPVATQTTLAPTNTPLNTPTPTATSTSALTTTVANTPTSIATTVAPTDTPVPTATPMPPTATPTPLADPPGFTCSTQVLPDGRKLEICTRYLN